MAKVKLNNIGINQFGGAAQYGNVTSYHAKLKTNAAGGAASANSAAPLGIGDVVILQRLPIGMRLEDAQVIVSTGMTATATGSLGFEYADGVDDAEVPQDAAYFGAGLNLAAVGRLRATGAKPVVTLPKDAYLTLTTAVAANAKVAEIDVLVYGERTNG